MKDAQSPVNMARRELTGINEMDYLKYYNLEKYIFDEVSAGYRKGKKIKAFDFFCIVIWKANRAKSRVAKRLLAQGRGYDNLDAAVGAFMQDISVATKPRDRLRVVIEKWGFRLPMASAILTVLFPADFTIYDVRVCKELGDFSDAQYKTRFEVLWSRYLEYTRSVDSAVTENLSLRDKDRYLWGRSFVMQLRKNIRDRFEDETDEGDSDE